MGTQIKNPPDPPPTIPTHFRLLLTTVWRPREETATMTVLLPLLLILLTVPHSWEEQEKPLRYNKELSKDVTTLLDSLLKQDKYDKRFRPDFGGT